MQKVTEIRNEICPLLDELIVQLRAEGSSTHQAHFSRIRGRIDSAMHASDLALPIIELSSCIAMGFQFSSTADALIHRILEKAGALADELAGVTPIIH